MIEYLDAGPAEKVAIYFPRHGTSTCHDLSGRICGRCSIKMQSHASKVNGEDDSTESVAEEWHVCAIELNCTGVFTFDDSRLARAKIWF